MRRTVKTHSLILKTDADSLTIPLEEDRAKTKGYAYGSLSILGTGFHVEAVSVRFSDEECAVVALNPDFQSMVDDFFRINDDRGTAQFVTFDMREWMVVIHAHLQ